MRLFINLNLNKLRILFSTFLFLIVFSSSVAADDTANQYLTMGLGNLSCNSFLSEDDDGAAYYLSWLAGYMTAYNYLQDDTYSILGETKTIEQIESWLRDYCTVNGAETYENAVRNLLKNLKYFRQKQKP